MVVIILASDIKDIVNTFGKQMTRASRFDASSDISKALGGGSVNQAGKARSEQLSDEELAELESKGRKAVASRRNDPELDAAYSEIMANSGSGPELGLSL